MSGAVTAVAAGFGASALGASALAAGAIGLGTYAVMNSVNQKTPTMPGVPMAPTAENSTQSMDQAAQAQQAAMMRGRTSTMLTGGSGLSDMGQTTSKQLLGS